MNRALSRVAELGEPVLNDTNGAMVRGRAKAFWQEEFFTGGGNVIVRTGPGSETHVTEQRRRRAGGKTGSGLNGYGHQRSRLDVEQFPPVPTPGPFWRTKSGTCSA